MEKFGCNLKAFQIKADTRFAGAGFIHCNVKNVPSSQTNLLENNVVLFSQEKFLH